MKFLETIEGLLKGKEEEESVGGTFMAVPNERPGPVTEEEGRAKEIKRENLEVLQKQAGDLEVETMSLRNQQRGPEVEARLAEINTRLREINAKIAKLTP